MQTKILPRMDPGLVLGLDGLDFDFLQEHRESLPTLSAAMEEEVHGRLRSTIPPTTSAAWTAGLSGMSPGRTGIRDFVADDENQSLVDATSINVPRAWDVVAAQGGTSAVLGVPLTHPVPEVDGIVVSGLTAPSNAVRTFPVDLESRLPDSYRFFINYREYGKAENNQLLDELYESTDAKFDLLERVLAGEVEELEEPPTFVSFVLSETDWIQHYFRTHPSDSAFETGEETVAEYLRHVDERVARILEIASELPVALMSDHGFGKYTSRHVFLNRWLAEQGHLTVSPVKQNSPLKDRLLDLVVRTVLEIPGSEHLVRWAPNSVKNNLDVSIGDIHLETGAIDWSRTQARFHASVHASGHITVSDDVDKADALIEAIVEGLNKLRDPQNRDKIIDEIYRGEEYYAGPDTTSLPDVVFTYRDEYNGSERVGDDPLVEELPLGARPPPTHAMDGFYMLVGDQFDSGRLDADIVDVMPTMYRAMGVPLPERTDGEVLEKALLGTPSAGQRAYQYAPTFVSKSNGEEEIRGRLEDLGYL